MAVGLLVVLAFATTAISDWLRSPIRIAEQVMGTNLPSGLERIAHEERWLSFGGDGFSVSVFRLPQSASADLTTRCESLGMRRGKMIAEPERFSIPERYINPNLESCYLILPYGMSAKVVAVSGETLVIYVQH